MTQIARLHQQLAQTASQQPTLHIDTAHPETAERQFLRILDSILLPRRVSIENTTNQSLEIDVSNRKILQVCSNPNAADAKLNFPTDATTFREILRETITQSQETSLRSTPIVAADPPTGQGISISALAQAWQINIYNDPHQTALENPQGFLQTLGEICTGCVIYQNGKSVETAGDLSTLQSVAKLCAQQLADWKTHCTSANATPSAPFCILLTAPENTMISAHFADSHLFLNTPTDQVGNVVTAWNDICET